MNPRTIDIQTGSLRKYFYLLTLSLITLTGFAQMPIFKRYYSDHTAQPVSHLGFRVDSGDIVVWPDAHRNYDGGKKFFRLLVVAAGDYLHGHAAHCSDSFLSWHSVVGAHFRKKMG